MQNTWSIGRTWKPREGWSRPVLTDERQHSFPDLFGERIILMQTIPYGNEHGMNTRRINASRPLSGSQAATRPADLGVWPYKRRFAAVMAQVRRPVPFRTRKLRPGTAMVLHSTGCGRVARRRITRTGSPRVGGVYLASLGLSVLGLTPPLVRRADDSPQRGKPETSWAPAGVSRRGPVRFGRQPAEYPVRCLRYQQTGQEVTRMVAPSRDDRSVDALVKSKAVLEVLAELGPSTAKTISERTGEPVSSTYRLLDNLVAVGWVERGINRGEYRLGIDCVRIGGQIESRLDIQQIARRTFRAHRGQFGIWGLFVRRRLRTVCIETRTRETLQSYAQLVGNSLPLSMSAPSHVLTAWLPPARYEQLLEHYAYTNELGGTFSTMRATAMGQARHIRECGFTYDVGQTMAGSVTISVPVFNHAGEIQAAIALSGLSRSLEPELACLVDGQPATASAQDMVRLVQTAGREVSRGLGYSGDHLGLNS